MCAVRYICLETPPQAWGRPQYITRNVLCYGNTPTGVGKTLQALYLQNGLQKHPHRRGEDISRSTNWSSETETPPQAWGRLMGSNAANTACRNTPTGVGKTEFSKSRARFRKKHPHRRGEDSITKGVAEPMIETPPQAWGRLRGRRFCWPCHGNTPTGVGKTFRYFAVSSER